jgi:cytochrome c oxidase cbb3-type subunit 3
MLTNNWSWYVITLAVLNIIFMVWLLMATNKKNDIDETDTTGHKWDGIEELNNPLPRWWLGLFIITIIFAVVYLYFYPGLGNYEGSFKWTQQSQFETELAENRKKQDAYFVEFSDLDVNALANNAKAMDTAERLFLNNCSACHGSSAQGAKGFPNLVDDDWLYGGDAKEIVASIANGRAGVMPNLSLGGKAEVLARYVQHLSGKTASPFVVEKGPDMFVVCTACHGPEGKGNHALGAPNLVDDIWLHGSSTNEIVAVLRNGKQGNMPSFSSLLSTIEIKLLAAYVMSLNSTELQKKIVSNAE